jgi:virulence-associated protein VagC
LPARINANASDREQYPIFDNTRAKPNRFDMLLPVYLFASAKVASAIHLVYLRVFSYHEFMATATVTTEGENQVVRLPRGFHLPTPTVQVRQAGDAIVLQPLKPGTWPAGFFDAVHITDPSFERPAQGELPDVKSL